MANWQGRATEMAATFMIGDGLLGLLQPRRHVALWQSDAMGAEHLVAPFVTRPGRRRAYALLQLAAGLALAARQRPTPADQIAKREMVRSRPTST